MPFSHRTFDQKDKTISMRALKLPTRLVLALALGLATTLPQTVLAESAAHGAGTEHAEAGAAEHTASAETPVAAEVGHDSHGETHAAEGDHASTGCDTDVLAKDVEVRKVNPIAAATMLPPPGCAWPVEEVEIHADAAAGEGGGHSAPAKSGGH
jgi:hypothetical protein